MTIDISSNQEVIKLRWSCRRGMLELDLLLGQFLEQGFSSLNSEDRELFKTFLNCTDQDLFAWLLGSAVPPNDHFLPLIKKIQAYVPLNNSLTHL